MYYGMLEQFLEDLTMKTKLIKRMVILSLSMLAIGAVGSIVTYPMAHKKVTLDLNKTVDASSVKQVSVKGTSMDITLADSPDNKIHVSVNGETQSADKFDIKTKQNGDTLEVTFDEPKLIEMNFVLFFNYNNRSATVSLPKSVKQATVKTNFGEIYTNNFVGESLELKTDAGDINLSGLKLTDLNAKTNAGSISLSQSAITNTDLKASAGALYVNNLVSSKTKLNTSAGNIDLNQVTGDLVATSNAGEIDLTNKTIDQNIDLQTNFGSIDVQSESKPTNLTVIAATDLGEMDIFDQNNREQTFGAGKYKMNLKTNAGDIEVNHSAYENDDEDFD